MSKKRFLEKYTKHFVFNRIKVSEGKSLVFFVKMMIETNNIIYRNIKRERF